MDDIAKVNLLNRVLHGTVNSVIQYIDAGAPYVPPSCTDDLARLRMLRDEEVETAGRITELIAALDGNPKVGVFDYWNVDLNYLDVRFMARFAAGHQGRTIAEIESVLDRTKSDPRLHGLLNAILEQKRAHLAVLQEVAARPSPKVDEERRASAQPKDNQHVPRPVRD